MDTLERAKEISLSQNLSNSYSADDAFNTLSSGVSSHANTLDRTSEFSPDGSHGREGRKTLMKHNVDADSDSLMGRGKRFSKRQSKSGLAAVF